MAIPSSSFWVKHCTTSVYNGHGTCRGLRPSQWGQPPRLSRRLAVKPHIGRVSQTANSMVIGPLRTFTTRLGGKRGEVKLDSFTGGHLLGNFARYQSRPRLPLREEDRTMALHLGGFPSGAGPACPALLWLRLLGHLASLEKLVPYGRLRIRPIQFQLRSGWSQIRGSLGSPLVEAFLFTDSSAVGWGAHMDKRTASGRWSEAMKELHINVLELNAIWLGLQAFEDTLHDSNVAIMCDNVSAIAYLRNQGGTRSQQMCRMAIDTCEWAEERSMILIPRHLPGHLNVLADHLSRRDQILKTEWSLNPAVARRVFRVWGSPHVDLFALKCNTKLATYMSPIPEPEAWKVDSLVQSWEGLYAYAYPPTSLIRQTLNKLILHRAELIRIAPLWPKQEWFPDLLRLSIAFPLVLPPTAKLLKQSFSHHFHQRPRILNLHTWRLSVDPIKLGDFRNKCPTGSLFLKENPRLTSMNKSGIPLENGVSLTELIHTRYTVPMIAEFLLHLFRDKQLTTITVKGYRSALSSLLASRGLDISHDPDLNALIRSFSIERPRTVRETPRWDLSLVLRLLMRHPFEPMNVCSLADLMRKTAFLLTLASAKRNSEVWAFSDDVVFGHDKQSATLRFLPGFIAKTQKPDRPDTALSPVTIPALVPFTGRSKRLFVSIKPGRQKDIAKATISGWIKGIIRSAYSEAKSEHIPHLTSQNVPTRELRAMVTSLAFHQHHSLKQVMEAASWQVDSTFASLYLRDLTPAHLCELGPLVAGQSVISDRLGP